ncbi:hypothetical protein N789_14505 [Arenimonas oryziterrae DSM 21050 = YC6267]|uniref:Uncharacterized protein n=2 Tax=Arenimonas TaxID=490567 RepID=A0A091BCP7_9GAMM|nr:hypothetical protein N789_14505 [Arenimonas oryziterrae DSM 21050 = YC6267]
MSSGVAHPSDPLREALRHYLARHPDAADSAEGIRRWWLPAAFQSVPDAKLQQALEHLVAAGEMQVHALPDGTELYARAMKENAAGETPAEPPKHRS